MAALRLAVAACLLQAGFAAPPPTPVELRLTARMKIDLDGAPNAYGPAGKETLDNELNAHKGAVATGKVVGYLTKADSRTPVVQGPSDPYPGYYISTSAYSDVKNTNKLDPRKYVDASKISYVVMSVAARKAGAKLGDFVAVHSTKHDKSVYGIIGDSGNETGAEGSLALIQALGYPFKDGRTGETDKDDVITIRYFPGSNPNQHFFKTQKELDDEAGSLHLNKSF